MKQDKGWVLSRKHTGHSKHSLPTTKETNLHVDITTYENTNTLATWWEELTYLKRPWFWERLKAGGEGDDRGWDGWMASPPQWTWVWRNSGSWWSTGRPGVLQSMGSQRVGNDWATEVNWNYGGGNEENGDLLQKAPCKHCYTQSSQPWSRPLLTCTSTGDTQTQFCLRLCGISGSWCAQGLFELSESLWQVWGLILNVNLPCLPSFWGFSFASLDVGYLLRSMSSCMLSPCLFNLHAEYIMWNARLYDSWAGIKIAKRNINNLSNADDITLMAESKEELNSLLIRVKEESEKVCLKLNI